MDGDVVMGLLVLACFVTSIVARELKSDSEQESDRIAASYARVAASLGLVHTRGRGAVNELSGRQGVFTILVTTRGWEEVTRIDGAWTRIVIKGADIGRALTLRDRGSAPEATWELPLAERSFAASPSGDPEFDAGMEVSGARPEVISVLDGPTRKFLSGLIGAGGQAKVKRGRLEVALRSSRMENISKLASTLEQCLAAARRVSLSLEDAFEALAVSAEFDPDPRVRVHSLDLLAESFPNTPAARRAGAAALTAKDPEVRLAGAMVDASAEAYACLVGMFAEPYGIAPGLRSRALRLLLDAYPEKDPSWLIASALESDEDSLQLAAAEALVSRSHAARLERMAAAAENDPSDLRAHAVHTELLLVNMLYSREDANRLAAVRALGTIGTLQAVEPLLALSKGFAQRGEVRRAARDAVRRIQTRLSAGGGGGLCLVAAAGLSGALSVKDPDGV